MLVLVIVLVVTNLVTLGVFAWFQLRPTEEPAPDERLARALSAAAGPSSTGVTRRVITIEVLNPIELAGTRGRLVGIAGSLAPGITRRLVYEQVLKILRRQLTHERVVADVRLLVVRPDEPAPVAAQTVQATVVEPVEVDLVKREDGEPKG